MRAGVVYVIKVCRHCGCRFTVSQSNAGRSPFCSSSCGKGWRLERKNERRRQCAACGKTFYPRTTQIRAGQGVFCSLKCRGVRDLLGLRFGRLVVTMLAGRTECGRRIWRCACDCGEQKDVTTELLNAGSVKSCGCFHREASTIRALRRNTPTVERATWNRMLYRCYKPTDDSYPIYGARGIEVCDRWRHSFDAFLEDMGRRPPGHSIERIDPNGNYEPSNCTWATKKEQARNRRTTRFVTLGGREMSLAEAAEILGVNYRRLWGLVVQRGMSADEAGLRLAESGEGN